ncbi:sensor histidine kinase, partial [Oceanivirga salmonicida]
EIKYNNIDKNKDNQINDNSIVLNPIRKNLYGNMETYILSFTKNVEIGNKKAIIILDLKYMELYKYLKETYLGDRGHVFIIDSNNNIIYSENIEKANVNKEKIIDRISQMKVGYDKKFNIIYFAKNIESTNWKIVGIYSGEKITLLKTKVLEIISFTIIITMLIMFFLIRKISEKITYTIKELQNYMLNMDTKLEKITLEGESFYEIEVLKNEINKMIEKINSLKSYEIKALYSQINPHFLYNTLDIIIWSIEFEDNDKAVEITKNLADFFRISLSNGENLISLEKELKHVKIYLDIQKERYQNKLTYNIEVKDEELLGKLVPKIILQPIVENALYHGIRNINYKGIVDIKVYKYNEDIIIEVYDNGVGIENTKENKLKLGGVGMKNIDSRIKHYLGDNYGLIVDKNIEKGTKIIVKLKEIEVKK